MDKNNIIKNQSGITIVALVVMIIVLMILATISIFSLTGDDGTINKANEAKKSATEKQIKTEINDEWYAIQLETRKDDYDNVSTKEKLRNLLQSRLNARLAEEGKEEDAIVILSQDYKKLIVSYKGIDKIELLIE